MVGAELGLELGQGGVELGPRRGEVAAENLDVPEVRAHGRAAERVVLEAGERLLVVLARLVELAPRHVQAALAVVVHRALAIRLGQPIEPSARVLGPAQALGRVTFHLALEVDQRERSGQRMAVVAGRVGLKERGLQNAPRRGRVAEGHRDRADADRGADLQLLVPEAARLLSRGLSHGHRGVVAAGPAQHVGMGELGLRELGLGRRRGLVGLQAIAGSAELLGEVDGARGHRGIAVSDDVEHEIRLALEATQAPEGVRRHRGRIAGRVKGRGPRRRVGVETTPQTAVGVRGEGSLGAKQGGRDRIGPGLAPHALEVGTVAARLLLWRGEEHGGDARREGADRRERG